MVLVLGFFTFISWSALLYALRSEKMKSNPDSVLLAKRRLMQEETDKLEKKLDALKSGKLEKETILHKLAQQIQILEKEKQQVQFSVIDLEKSVTAFFDGWLAFVNGKKDNTELKIRCEETMQQFSEKHFNSRHSIVKPQ